MPLYTYRCPAGHELEFLVKYDDRDKHMACPTLLDNAHGAPSCLQPLTRAEAELNAKSFPGADSWRKK